MTKSTFGILMGIMIVFCVLCIATLVLLFLKYVNDKTRWKEEAEERFKAGKEEAASIIRMTMDQIQTDRGKFVGMSEKELMVETMMALGSYGRRIDRIEDKIECISNYKEHINEIKIQIKAITNNCDILRDDITNANSSVGTFRQITQDATADVRQLNENLSNIADIKRKVDLLVENINRTVYMLENMYEQISDIAKNTNEVLDTYGDAPMVKLNSIETMLEDVKDLIDDVDDEIDNVNNELNDVKNKVGDALDQYSSYSLFSRLESVQNDLESVKDKINESLDQYGYSSLYRKIEEVGEKIESKY